MADSAVILGGYGAAGVATARLLLQETQLQLVLAGRDQEKASKVAAQISSEFQADRVRGLGVDATDPTSLREALQGLDLLIVCIPLEGITAGVVHAALEARVDWIDISLGTRKQEELRKVATEITDAGCCFITEAGAVPGLPSVLVRLAADRFDQLNSAFVSVVMKEPNIALGSALDVIRMVTTPAFIYENESWRQTSITETRVVDFGELFGKQRCYPMDFLELHELSEKLHLQGLGMYSAGVNPFVDLISIIFALGKLGKIESAVQAGAKLIVWANRRFTKPPFGIQLKLEAEGTIDGTPVRMQLLAEHEDGYQITAIPLVASILQLLDGSARNPGLIIMGNAVDSNRLLEDMQRMGLRVVDL